MKTSRLLSVGLRCLVGLPLLATGQTYASPLSDSPLFLGGNISPNLMFTLDDSGSMQFEVIPENSNVYFTFPRPDPLYGANWGYGSSYSYVAKFDLTNKYARYYRTAKFNRMYYDPAIRYVPWTKADGTLMSNASSAAAYHNPGIDGLGAGEGSRNLTANNTQTARWVADDGTNASASLTFYPATYFATSLTSLSGPTDANNIAANFTKVEIKSANAPFPKAAGRTDCAGSTCTYAEEIQNFANWYTYYRSRILTARAGVGKAFARQGNTMRVGFASLNKGSSTIDGTNTDVIVQGVRQFDATGKTNFFNTFYGYTMPSAGTPLREALYSVGRYFKRTDDKGPWGETPGSTGGTQHACRQSYDILMTDGYWTNSTFNSVANADGTAGSSITNDSTPANPTSYTYTAVAPYSDSNSNTLADVAMYFWKNDLRTDLANKVPTNTDDPAFWQHLVNFTVGLGVAGSLPYTDPATGPWPNPTTDPAKVDDLWHAAVNSRGGFYSASDPTTFADALSGSLTNIVARTGSASAVATSSSSLTTNGRLYQAKFNSGDWSGQLLSIPIDTTGTIGTTEWDAGSVINTLTPASRIIITKGNTGDGVAFQYANLTSAQQTSLNSNVASTTDNCGPERVDYLRGDSTHEGTGTFVCATTPFTSISEFRDRVNSKLGDIVNSSPYYVGSPSAGYSDVDQPGYAAFSGSSGNGGRTPMVYVGANDGILHGFNACVAGVTPGCLAADEGKELIAYIPSMVYGNLNRLPDANYNANHRYFVDGSPMVADADLGTTGSPSWKSVLVGGLNGGGQGYFSLDVTNPNAFSVANAASLLLWEFTNADDSDMGYSYNLASVDPFTSQARQIVQMENGEWAVVVGNGYNSAGGHAMLYVLFLKGGLDGSWTIGTDYIKLVADSGTGNGLSAPIPFDSDGDGKADVIYAGDLKGNMWKFNVSSTTPASWSSGTLLFAAGTNKPITSPPVVTLHPSGGQLVLFGTGKYLETVDTTSTLGQTIYGIWDTGATVTAGQLVSQVVTPATTTTPMTSTQHTVPYSTTGTIIKGWYLNLPVSGERLAGIPALEDGLFNFSTIAPSSSPCDFGGSGWDYTVDYLTGGMLGSAAFDTNGDGIIDSSDALAAGVAIGFAPGGVTRVRGASSDILVSSRADGTLVKTPVTKGPATLRGRVNWREIVQ
ncbi:MAG: PilC/PilY family type IV pilus protein [Thiobacillus sp.]|nr:PilC/PilY family type IV pilus protein [Thiobacillus sp.]